MGLQLHLLTSLVKRKRHDYKNVPNVSSLHEQSNYNPAGVFTVSNRFENSNPRNIMYFLFTRMERVQIQFSKTKGGHIIFNFKLNKVPFCGHCDFNNKILFVVFNYFVSLKCLLFIILRNF